MAARLTAYLVVAIVGATFIAGLIVGAQRDDSDVPVDLIVRNGVVFTADRRGTTAEAVAVRGNRILRVGSNREIERLRRPQTVVLDARGGSILPGFNDTSLQLVHTGPLAPDRSALAALVSEANALGITSAHTIAESPSALELYNDLKKSGGLTLRVYASVPVQHPLTQPELDSVSPALAKYSDDPLFKSGALSIRLDGPVRSREAALLEPYRGLPAHAPESSGTTTLLPDDLNRTVRLADAAGWQITIHANGDRAVRMALNAYAHAVRSNRPPDRGRRHRIQGAALVDAADLARFEPLDIIAAMQPHDPAVDEHRAEMLSRLLGEARATRLFDLQPLDEEARIVFGSGGASQPRNPLEGLQAATAGERLSMEAAVRAYTSEPAWASFDEQRKGSIAPGMLADMVVLTGDIFELEEEDLAGVSVAYTVFDGRVVYRGSAPRVETEPAAIEQP